MGYGVEDLDWSALPVTTSAVRRDRCVAIRTIE